MNKSYIVNTGHIESFDNNDIFIKSYEIAIGNSYRDDFFEGFVMKQRVWDRDVVLFNVSAFFQFEI